MGSERQGSSPYATGGGGTVLEHCYGAVLLAHLLTGAPVPMLGDDVTPVKVQFQAGDVSPVDDLLVVGRVGDGSERVLAIGVRRAPTLVASDAPSARLLSSFLRVIGTHWPEIQQGRWRLGLAVAAPNPAVSQLQKLCATARATPDAGVFHDAVAAPGKTSRNVWDRLVHVQDLVRLADQAVGSGLDPEELTWRLLSSLSVVELRLEGADLSDRTGAVERLQAVTRDGTPASADALFSRLIELAGRYAPSGAQVTESSLRRDLSGLPLARSSSFVKAWRILDFLASSLRDHTRSSLEGPSGSLRLERRKARADLADRMAQTAATGGALVVDGEPQVGKSALTLRACELLEASERAVVSLSLRDLPRTILELDGLLGAAPVDVFAGLATGAGRLLLVDGAEAALEGRDGMLRDLAAAAFRSGMGVAAVTRRDALDEVRRILAEARRGAGGEGGLDRYEVPALAASEVQEIAAWFPALARLASEPRAGFLVTRPGLVDLILREGAYADLPEGPLSEADVFAVVWHAWVRRREVHTPGGPSPDARERALLSMARGLLMPEAPEVPPDADALPSLRSDGLLLPRGAQSAWVSGDRFGSDLYRDLAVTRLLVVDGWSVLERAGAPRGALRAARTACQAHLALPGTDSELARARLQATFDNLAERHGERWAEVPWEALLTLGAAREALGRVWPALLQDEQAGLRALLQLALRRFSELGFGDPAVLEPLVELACFGDRGPNRPARHVQGDVGRLVREALLSWMRGLVRSEAGPQPLRQRVRDWLLAMEVEAYDKFLIEALALLGPDLDKRAEDFLRNVALHHSAYLAPAVEEDAPILALSAHQPDLLIALAEAYYVEPADRGAYGWTSALLHGGIRSHHRAGAAAPLAGWYLGPFYRLLNVRPVETLAMINRLLDHAAHVRAVPDEDPEFGEQPSSSVPCGIDLPWLSPRRFVGDAQVWLWYRRSSVGPYPCMSALLAVERFADHLVDNLDIQIAKVAWLLLKDCHNLAMPALVVGLLVRHLDKAGALLDRWLAQPEIWDLECQRVSEEGLLHVQGPDPPDLVGRDRRRYTFRDVAAEMTMKAILAKDEARLETLRQVADELLRNARKATLDEASSPEEVATIQGWAALFRRENYRLYQDDHGRLVMEYTHPEDVAAALAASRKSLERDGEASRLLVTYACTEDRVAPVATLLADLAVARDLLAHPADEAPNHPVDAAASVAAAGIVAHARGDASVPGEDLRWAAEVLVQAALQPRVTPRCLEASRYPMGADRSAAAALPSLLLPVFDGIGLDWGRVVEALRRCATSLFDEVRAAFAPGLKPVWEASCGVVPGLGLCRHRVAWEVVNAGLQDCRLEPWGPGGQRCVSAPLDGPFEVTLPAVSTESLLVNRLTHPLVSAAKAARAGNCIAEEARRLLEVLFEAHRRGSEHWAEEGYAEHFNRYRSRVARVLAETAAAGDGGPLSDYVRAFASNPEALRQLLHDLAVLFTYDEAMRPDLPGVWRLVMQTALDAWEAGADLPPSGSCLDDALAGLVPKPTYDPGDRDFEATRTRARQGWATPEQIGDLVARWIPLARRSPDALDSFVGFAECASPAWQVTTGLEWTEALIDGAFSEVARRCWLLAEWLERLRGSGRLDAEGTKRWHRIVDGLAASGDRGAVRLQKTME